VKPLPETDEALDELVGHDARDLRAQLLEIGRQAQAIVPFCVGVSLMLVREGLTLTLVAGDDEEPLAEVVEGEPGAEAEADGDDVLSEECWSRVARQDAASGVLSSLSLPIKRGSRVVGGVVLYAAVAHSFDGRHVELADALGASAEDAVTDADLSFSSRAAARQAPDTVADLRDIDVAVGTLAAWQGRGVEAALRSLEAAAGGRLSLVEAARLVLGLRP